MDRVHRMVGPRIRNSLGQEQVTDSPELLPVVDASLIENGMWLGHERASRNRLREWGTQIR